MAEGRNYGFEVYVEGNIVYIDEIGGDEVCLSLLPKDAVELSKQLRVAARKAKEISPTESYTVSPSDDS